MGRDIQVDALRLFCKACDYNVCCPCVESRPSWQFETDSAGLWSFMSQQDVSKLESKYNEDPSAKTTMTLGTKNWNYTIDFTEMTQMNPRNSTTRKVRRVGGPYVKSTEERRREEDEKQEEQRRKAQEVAEQIQKAEARMEEEAKKRKAEVQKQKKAEAAAKKKAEEERQAEIKRLEAEAEAAAKEAEAA